MALPPKQVQFHQVVTKTASNVHQFLQSRNAMLAAIKINLTLAKEQIKMFADLKRSEREFSVGDWVFLNFTLTDRLVWQ